MRDQFLLRDDVVFLNHGSFGACPRPVFEHYQALQRELEAQPLEFLARRYYDLLAEARARLAAFVGCGANDLVFVTNATSGLNVVARSLDLQPGDEILGTNHEYGALDRTWQFLCGKTGATYVRQPLPQPLDDAAAIVDAVWSGVTERTKVLFISHLTAPTAVILPVKALVDKARAAGLISIVDGAHAPGQLDLDLTALGADFYAGNCHKWMMSPKGAAFLYARPARQSLLEPLVVSWGWQPVEPGISPFIDEQEWTGTRDPSAWLSVPAAIDFMAANNWPEQRVRCHRMILKARAEITALTGEAPICPASTDWFVQMHALPLPTGTDGPALQQALLARFNLEIPVMEWNGRCYIRPSAQAYNVPADYEALVSGLEALLSETG